MKNTALKISSRAERRRFLKNVAAGGATVGAGLLASGLPAFGGDGGSPTKGDIAILRFLAAAEAIEADLWKQYAELGGTQVNEPPLTGQIGGSAAYTAALANLDGDMPQYIFDNWDDEVSHVRFLNAYLVSKGADPVNLDQFRTLEGSKATGADQIGRLTNLMQLTVDTSWWTRYRSSENNPDLDPGFKFPQAVPSLKSGQFPAIPRSDDDLAPQGHIQAIANTAAFHFGFIEAGGTSLYPTLAQQVTDVEVLRVLLSIGPEEAMHFQVWHDKAGAAVSPPLAPLTDADLMFPDLTSAGEDFQPNLIMPEPCPFLSRKLPVVSIIRPTGSRAGGAVATVKALTADGLFIGQSKEFFQTLNDLAGDADSAERGSY